MLCIILLEHLWHATPLRAVLQLQYDRGASSSARVFGDFLNDLHLYVGAA